MNPQSRRAEDLAAEQPTTSELMMNLKTPKQIDSHSPAGALPRRPMIE
jgi:hypothetical protein